MRSYVHGLHVSGAGKVAESGPERSPGLAEGGGQYGNCTARGPLALGACWKTRQRRLQQRSRLWTPKLCVLRCRLSALAVAQEHPFAATVGTHLYASSASLRPAPSSPSSAAAASASSACKRSADTRNDATRAWKKPKSSGGSCQRARRSHRTRSKRRTHRKRRAAASRLRRAAAGRRQQRRDFLPERRPNFIRDQTLIEVVSQERRTSDERGLASPRMTRRARTSLRQP